MIATAIIEIPSWGNVTLIELIWLLIGALQSSFCALHLRPLTEDWLLATRNDRPVLREIAWGYLRREIVRLASGLAILGVGGYAAVMPNAIPGPSFITPIGIVITFVFFFIAYTSAIQSLWDWKMRHTVQRLISEGANGHASS